VRNSSVFRPSSYRRKNYWLDFEPRPHWHLIQSSRQWDGFLHRKFFVELTLRANLSPKAATVWRFLFGSGLFCLVFVVRVTVLFFWMFNEKYTKLVRAYLARRSGVYTAYLFFRVAWAQKGFVVATDTDIAGICYFGLIRSGKCGWTSGCRCNTAWTWNWIRETWTGV